MQKKLSHFSVLFFTLFLVPVLFSDNQYDTLPLGPSKFRYSLAQLEAQKLMQTSDEKIVTIPEIIESNMDTDVFILGELHDSYECHKFQRDFIEALFKKFPKIIVGFEFFERKDDKFLELWRTGKLEEERLLRKTSWYARTNINYGYTRMVMDIIRKHKIKAIGLNVPRDIIHKVSTKGFENLTNEEKSLFPDITISNPEHEYYIKSIFGKLGVRMPMWFKNIYNAQKCWDIVMAWSMRKILSKKEYKNWKGIIIAGSAHVAYGLGIPYRYRLGNEKVKITTIVPVMIPSEKEDEEEHPMARKVKKEEKPSAIFSRGIADYVLAISPSDKDYFPSFGFSGKMNKNGEYEITRVKKGSFAEKNSFAPGDVIISIDGIKINSVEQLRLILSQKKWDDSVIFEIRKKIKIKK
jgi:uncharacterized iron-regulated protein